MATLPWEKKTPIVHDSKVSWITEQWTDSTRVEGDVEPIFGFLGIPYDGAVSSRPGTRFGPEAIVESLNRLTAYCTDKRVDLSKAHMVHYGSVDVVHSLAETGSRIIEANQAIPIHVVRLFLGGDHSISDPLFRSTQSMSEGRKLGLIVFDSHLDSREPERGKEHSGNWLFTLNGVLDYNKTVQLGINSCLYSQVYMEEAERRGVMIKTIYEIHKEGWSNIIRQAIAKAATDTDGVYISFDIDCIDRAFAPGTSVPNASGFHPSEVMDAVYELAVQTPALAFDISEVSPPLDCTGATADVAAQLVLNFMAGIVARSKANRA